MKMLSLFFIVLLTSSNNYSQTQNQHPFFPHHVGDLWEYTEWEFWGLPLSHFQAIIIADTVDSLGNSHVHFINNVFISGYWGSSIYHFNGQSWTDYDELRNLNFFSWAVFAIKNRVFIAGDNSYDHNAYVIQGREN